MYRPPTFSAGNEHFAVLQGGAPVLLARLCHELRVRKIVNAMVQWDPDQCRVSPGTLVVALILNVLVDRRPLYKVADFYRRRDLSLLFEEHVEADWLNDDAFGRTLDRLAAIDLPRLVQSVALCALRVGQLQVRSVHADTTSVSVFGAFAPTPSDEAFCEEHPDKQLVEIARGYSKQKRPDLKQFLCGLVVSQDGLPLMGDIRDGHLSDKVWNREVLDAMEQSFLDPAAIVYVADSSLVTKKNLAQLVKPPVVRFISRLPATFSATDEAKRHAFAQDQWTSVGPIAQRPTARSAVYHTTGCTREIDGYTYRLVVVRSSALDKRTQKKWERSVKREREQLRKAAKTLVRQRFNCREDAEAALQAFVQGEHLHKLKGLVIKETEEKRPPGRPRKDAVYPRITTYRLDVSLFEPDAQTEAAWLERERAFVLITNLPEETWSDAAILKEYKNQVKVEQGFRLYKHPIVADGIFLKSTRRVEAFAYVAVLALLVASFLQCRVRRRLGDAPTADQQQMRLLQGERKTDRPTSVALLEEIDYIQVLWRRTSEGFGRYVADELPLEHVRLLALAGFGPEIYFESMPTA